MSLLGSELCEVYGNSFVQEMNMSKTKKSRKKEKKLKKKYTPEDTVGDALLNDFSYEADNLVEGFANFEKKPEPRVEIVQTEQFDEDEDSESEPEERNYTVKRKKVKSKPVIKEKVQCEMDDMNEKISDLDVKLNLLLEKLNDREETRDSKKPEEKNEMTNIYDLILFVIFGVFFLLLLESISKVVVKNATKLNNANSLVFNN